MLEGDIEKTLSHSKFMSLASDAVDGMMTGISVFSCCWSFFYLHIMSNKNTLISEIWFVIFNVFKLESRLSIFRFNFYICRYI